LGKLGRSGAAPYKRRETPAQQIWGAGLLKNARVLILTDDSEFGRLLSSCWQAEQQAPSITTLNSGLWKVQDAEAFDLVVVGPVGQANLAKILSSLHAGVAVILCAPADFHEMQQLRSRYPRLLHVPLRDDWTQTLMLVAGESLRRIRAGRQARQAISRAARSEREAVLGRYMAEMKHSVNNALTSILGNAELLLLEPGQLSAQSLHQIKTMHSMALRINEIMQRFSSLASEIREAENASQAETEDLPESLPTRT
jgi:signal transduction histidine kinase